MSHQSKTPTDWRAKNASQKQDARRLAGVEPLIPAAGNRSEARPHTGRVIEIAAREPDILELAVGQLAELAEIGAIAPPSGDPLQDERDEHGEPLPFISKPARAALRVLQIVWLGLYVHCNMHSNWRMMSSVMRIAHGFIHENFTEIGEQLALGQFCP
jgi:hypothetical protein